jgi:DNA-binding CsgD family transcriptional regulator
LGRAQEKELLADVVESARSGASGVLVVRGDPGIGKSVLLDHVASKYPEIPQIRVAGTETEAGLGFAALQLLLRPIITLLEHLPKPQRGALRTAFGLTEGSPSDLYLVGLATLNLVATAAAECGLLCLVDDAQWLDFESARVIAFVARRLQMDRVVLLISTRDSVDGSPSPFDGLEVLHLQGLPEQHAFELLTAEIGRPIDQPVADLFIARTGANPLALIELAGEIHMEGLDLNMNMNKPVAVSARLEAHFLGKVQTLAADSQVFALIAAAETEDDPTTLWKAAGGLGLSPDASHDVIESGLLQVNPTIRFRHPLIRSAIYNGASEAERRRVHEAIAMAIDPEAEPDRQAWHRAASIVRPDDELAEALDLSAARARSRGGWSAEADFLLRAAELTMERPRRASRMVSAASAALTAGMPQRAEALLDRAEAGSDEPKTRARALRIRGAVLRESRPSEAVPVLLAAAKASQRFDGRLARDCLLEAFEAEFMARANRNDATDLDIALAAAATPLTDPAGASAGDFLLDGFAARATGHYADAARLFRQAVSIALSDDLLADHAPRLALLVGAAANDIWDWDTRATVLEKLAHGLRSRGALASLRACLLALSDAETQLGHFTTAEALLVEAADITHSLGVPLDSRAFDVPLLAWKGDDLRFASAAALEIAAQRGIGSMTQIAYRAATLRDISVGQYEYAVAAGMIVFNDDGPSQGNHVLPDLVEAGARSGNTDIARAALERLNVRALASGAPLALGLLARSQAIMTDGDAADALYRESIDYISSTPIRTELGRSHLLFGEWLRRKRRREDARGHLRIADDMFTAMGANAFARRAQSELEATGEHPRKRGTGFNTDLTPQETRIARFAADGHTNAEIASELFLSTSTVDYHLGKVFRKLAVNSRRQLRRVLPD